MPRQPGWVSPPPEIDPLETQQCLDGLLAALRGVASPPASNPLPDCLYPFQRDGIAWVQSYPHVGAILADDMGLGKTVQSILAVPPNAPALILCPLGVVEVWAREISRWLPDRPYTVVRKLEDRRWPKPGETIIMNVDKLWCNKSEYPGMANPPDTAEEMVQTIPEGLWLVFDEFHLLKGGYRDTRRVRRWTTIQKAVQRTKGFILGLTGTPILNNKREIVNLLQAAGILDVVFPRGWTQIEREMRLNETWAPVSPEIKYRLRSVMLRRTREEVFPEMPEKIIQEIPVKIPPTLGADMDALWSKLATHRLDTLEEFMSALWAEGGIEVFSLIRAALASAKIPALEALVDVYTDAGEPLVVCSAYRGPVDAIGKRKGWGTITGDVTGAARGKVEDDFREGKLKGVALTMKAGGVGISLTRASHMILSDLEWSPKIVAQAEDRLRPHLHRESCHYTYLVARHPMEEHLYKLLNAKKRLIADVMGD